ncbi:MAG: HNH endonuclease [Bilifractor sp.]
MNIGISVTVLCPLDLADVPHPDQKIFWDRSNWQALCKKCHDKKTGQEDRTGRQDRKIPIRCTDIKQHISLL